MLLVSPILVGGESTLNSGASSSRRTPPGSKGDFLLWSELLSHPRIQVTTTKTGHKLLPAYIRVIQGDGIGLNCSAADLTFYASSPSSFQRAGL